MFLFFDSPQSQNVLILLFSLTHSCLLTAKITPYVLRLE